MQQTRPVKSYPPPRTAKKTAGEWAALILGWLFIIGVVGLLAYGIKKAEPDRPIVCSQAAGTVSLTRFGTCRRE